MSSKSTEIKEAVEGCVSMLIHSFINNFVLNLICPTLWIGHGHVWAVYSHSLCTGLFFLYWILILPLASYLLSYHWTSAIFIMNKEMGLYYLFLKCLVFFFIYFFDGQDLKSATPQLFFFCSVIKKGLVVYTVYFIQ